MAKGNSASGFSWKNDIPDSNIYESGYYNMDIETCEVGVTTKGHKQYRASCRITEPREFKGQMYFARFVVGTEDDPDAEDPNTWKAFGAMRLKNFLDKAGAKDGHPDKVFPDLEGESICAQLGKKTQTKGDYAGTENQTDRWFKIGEREPGLIGQAAGGNGTARTRRHEPVEEDEPAAPARRGRPAADEDEDEGPRRARR